MTKPIALIVLDGFGLGDGGPADATAVAHAPFFVRLRREFPMAKIETSGEAFGLPPGQMANSEVGHMTLGAGRITREKQRPAEEREAFTSGRGAAKRAFEHVERALD